MSPSARQPVRKLFVGLEDRAYLNAGSFGPLRRSTLDAMRAELERAAAAGRGSDTELCTLEDKREALRAAFAGVGGVSPDNIALTASTTDGVRIVVAGLGLGPTDSVVTTDVEHAAVQGICQQLPARVSIASIDGESDGEVVRRITQAVTATTRLVVISHVAYATGQRLPVEAVARELDIPVLVDGAQAVGAVPCDFAAADFYTISGQKWLCGPDQVGALYVRHPQALHVASPSSVRFMGEAFGGGRIGTARDLDYCWLSGPVVDGMLDALGHFDEDLVLCAHTLADRCRQTLREVGCVVATADNSPLVVFRLPVDSAEFVRAAERDGVIIRALPGSGLLRAAFGAWNDETDIARLVQAIRDHSSVGR